MSLYAQGPYNWICTEPVGPGYAPLPVPVQGERCRSYAVLSQVALAFRCPGPWNTDSIKGCAEAEDPRFRKMQEVHGDPPGLGVSGERGTNAFPKADLRVHAEGDGEIKGERAIPSLAVDKGHLSSQIQERHIFVGTRGAATFCDIVVRHRQNRSSQAARMLKQKFVRPSNLNLCAQTSGYHREACKP